MGGVETEWHRIADQQQVQKDSPLLPVPTEEEKEGERSMNRCVCVRLSHMFTSPCVQ